MKRQGLFSGVRRYFSKENRLSRTVNSLQIKIKRVKKEIAEAQEQLQWHKDNPNPLNRFGNWRYTDPLKNKIEKLNKRKTELEKTLRGIENK